MQAERKEGNEYAEMFVDGGVGVGGVCVIVYCHSSVSHLTPEKKPKKKLFLLAMHKNKDPCNV